MRTRSRWRFIASTYCDGTAENLAWWEFGIFLIGGQIGVAGGDLVCSIVLVSKKMSANGDGPANVGLASAAHSAADVLDGTSLALTV